ncbi:MAG: Flp pilus assembly protein CpaB [Burkholderia contaminans]|uniref:Flp pilus assembly protein CpaB n=1 Tax=Burkholderia contaminans TaxID=488447 RepID=A0AAP4QYK4_9BURK|nr:MULTISPECIES: Flp pilus assembly protein CpaB [Burkholderia]MBD1414568.1 Flp pilus assembly protein CpaB [Burkholderia contaminans]MBH9667472.1 Flp pilus assembly protein CpaB [Burkholderia contaminans]MBH9674834.1 Flp pilus assembly protein CpaB [Burkholderia contaminans]MBH9705162.1 Flp pilus assembly protein CpaB [Burkholderia contaminans]MBH9721153.1 Flp pilus assembly protein CpaB [Burkholderia contaminans]
MGNNLTKIIAGLLIALAVLLGIYAWMLGRAPAHPPAAAPAVATVQAVPVVVATRLLPAGQPIPADALKLASAPMMPTGGFSDPSLPVGRIPANDILAAAPVVEGGLTSGLANQVAPGERAVAIKVDETNAVGNRLRPGNFVDVFLNLRRDNSGMAQTGSEIPNSQARLLMSKLRILSFGDATPDRDGSGGPGGAVRTAVLAVPTAQVDALTLAEASGRLTLALRNPRDDEVATQTVAIRTAGDLTPSGQAAAGVWLDELSGGRARNTPRVQAPATRAPRAPIVAREGGSNIEVIRGGRTETVAY